MTMQERLRKNFNYQLSHALAACRSSNYASSYNHTKFAYMLLDVASDAEMAEELDYVCEKLMHASDGVLRNSVVALRLLIAKNFQSFKV